MKQRVKNHIYLAGIAMLGLGSIIYAVYVFVDIKEEYAMALKKIDSHARVSAQIQHTQEDTQALHRLLQQHQQRYQLYYTQSQPQSCDNGAYDELTDFAQQYHIDLERMERRQKEWPQQGWFAEESTISSPDFHVAWQNTPVVFELSGNWSDYVDFRFALMRSHCWIQTVSEQIQSVGSLSQIRSRLSLQVMRPVVASYSQALQE